MDKNYQKLHFQMIGLGQMKNTTLTIGTQTYPARFDTTHYENLYDFSNVTGYDQNGHYVERYLSINTLKADSSISFSYNLSLDKV